MLADCVTQKKEPSAVLVGERHPGLNDHKTRKRERTINSKLQALNNL